MREVGNREFFWGREEVEKTNNFGQGTMCFLFIPKTASTASLSQPHFEKSVSMKLTLSKWELGSPAGLPKFQSSIARVKTPHILAFIPLKSY
jgi:hypothetical protein